MFELGIAELDQLILDGRKALRYAWDHYKELASRKSAYTLYGPCAPHIGAGVPGKMIPESVRALSKQPCADEYMVYELDSGFKLLSTKIMRNGTEAEGVYYCFELDGIQYACHFFSAKKKIHNSDDVIAIGCKDGLPWYLGLLGAGALIAEFFDYGPQEKMIVTGCRYSQCSMFSPCSGEPVDDNAPIGEGSSPVKRACWKEDAVFTDFSQWFQR